MLPAGGTTSALLRCHTVRPSGRRGCRRAQSMPANTTAVRSSGLRAAWGVLGHRRPPCRPGLHPDSNLLHWPPT